MTITWKIDVVGENANRTSRTVHCSLDDISDPVTRYQILLLSKLGFRRNQKLAKFRQFFSSVENTQHSQTGEFSVLFVDNYWENEAAHQLTPQEARRRLHGVAHDVIPLVGTDPHWIEFQVAILNNEPFFGTQKPILSEPQQFTLRHFVSDAQELARSRFYSQPSSFSLTGSRNGPQLLKTIGAEHVGHFVAVFRKLYGHKEHSNFKKACDAVQLSIGGTPFGKFLAMDRRDLNKYLDKDAGTWPLPGKQFSFKNSELIRVFLYSKYLHQPDPIAEAELGRMASEVGGIARLEAEFFFTVFHVATKFVNWASWIRNLCEFAGMDLSQDTRAPATGNGQPHMRIPEDSLSPECREQFDSLALELSYEFRQRDGVVVEPKPMTHYLDMAKRRLREVF
jgi:hypothetical protein